MGTETKLNSHKEKTPTTGNSISHPQVELNGSSSTICVSEKLYATNGSSSNALNCKHKKETTPVFVPIQIGEDVISGAKEILKVIRPHWKLHHLQFKKFTDGITNKLVGCFYNPTLPTDTSKNGNDIDSSSSNSTPIAAASSNSVDENNDSGNISDTDTVEPEVTTTVTAETITHNNTSPSTQSESNPANSSSNVVLVRVYGNKTDLLIDRKAETRNILLLQKYGFAPTLFATFKNGLAYDFVPGVTLNPTSVFEPAVWPLVAIRMAEMHRRVKVHEEVAGNSDGADYPLVPMLWRKMQSFFDLVPEHFTDADKHKRVKDTFLPIKRLRDEFNSLYRHLERLESPVVFAHNDLLLGNIVYLESQPCVSFIDFEYTDYNFQAFDIGNHFCEFAGVDEVDYSRYPKRDFQLGWLRVYLQEYLQRSHVTDDEVERLYLQVNYFALASHMFWIVWALIQAEHSTIDFDYVDYAHIRYEEYQKHKSKLDLQPPAEDAAAETS